MTNTKPMHEAMHTRARFSPFNAAQPTSDTGYPLENTSPAEKPSDYEPEGREFDSLRARHFFPPENKPLRDFPRLGLCTGKMHARCMRLELCS